jgi:hypothetical protein
MKSQPISATPSTLFHKDCLATISWLNKMKWGELQKNGSPVNEIKARLKNTPRGLVIVFHHHITKETFKTVAPGKTFNNIRFEPTNKSQSITLVQTYLHSYSPPKFEGVVDFVQSVRFSKRSKLCYKLILPLSKEIKFHNQIEHSGFISDLGFLSHSAINVEVSGVKLIACVLKEKTTGKHFLSIESRTKLDFDSFKDLAHSVRNGIAYLTGYLSGNRAYYFGFADAGIKTVSQFCYMAIRPEIRSGYSPICSNPFTWIRGSKVEANRFYSKRILRNISETEFSTLCQKLYSDLEFTSVVLLILESSVASLTFMPGGFAIALEMLSDLVIAGQKLNLNPIKDKKLSKEIRKECLTAIDNRKAYIGDNAHKILTNKINGLNQVTNSARLKAPFDLLNIPLLPKDIDIINTRNDFLHGKVPDITNAGPNRSKKRMNDDLYYASMRFYTLLNMIILKWIGYDNYVLNYPKIQQQACRVKLREKHYRKV